MKKKLLKTTFTEKKEKMTKFLIFQKHINPKKNSFQPIGYPDVRKTIESHNRQRNLAKKGKKE